MSKKGKQNLQVIEICLIQSIKGKFRLKIVSGFITLQLKGERRRISLVETVLTTFLYNLFIFFSFLVFITKSAYYFYLCMFDWMY